jgi:DNA (cytosine-5)-methyltransferase 1
MNYRSVCSGIEAATVAWEPLGWRALSFSEIEPFPCSVLAHRFPSVPNLGDMTRFAEWSDDDPTDVLVGGTPCQSFSVAGLRKGLADPRGNLALVYLAIADRFRPRWIVWENVPGVLSSNGGRDFGAFLGALGQLGYGYAYRVLDAQHFGVPQRRRRVFVVGHLGDWRRAAAVLFESESLCGNPAKGGQKREDVTGTLASRTSGGGGLGTDFDCDGGVIASNAEGSTGLPFLTKSNIGKCVNNQTPLIAHSLRGEGFDASEDGTGRGTPLVPIAFNSKTDAADYGETSPTLRAMGHGGSHANAGGQVAIAFQSSQSGVRTQDVHATLDSNNGSRRHNGVIQGHAVRRLTPRECERLQGFPTFIDRVIIDLCSGHQSDDVRAEVRCLRSPSNALLAGDGERRGLAMSADVTLWNDQVSRDAHAAVHVRMSHEPKAVAIRSLGKWLWCVSGADRESWSHPSMQADLFAQGLAVASRELARETSIGRAESHRQQKPFTLHASGSSLAGMFGRESAESVRDAEQSLREAIRFITSSREPRTGTCGLTAQTWLSFVALATSSFIHRTTRAANSLRVVIDVESDWTLVPHRGKPAADGPRYKAIGNSMAVPVMRWIGRRIQLIETIPPSELDPCR